MSKKPSYKSRVSQDRMNRIDDLCRIKPMTQLQLATELNISNARAYDYLKFMCENEWLSVTTSMVPSFVSAKSFIKTIVLTPVLRKSHNRGIEHPCRMATNVKPFRDEWACLFFGRVSRV